MKKAKHINGEPNGYTARLVAIETRVKNIETLAYANNAELLKINQEFRTRLDRIETERRITHQFIEKEQQEEKEAEKIQGAQGFTKSLNRNSLYYLLIGLIVGPIIQGIFSVLPKVLMLLDHLSTVK